MLGVGSMAKISESTVVINQTNILNLVKGKRGMELNLGSMQNRNSVTHPNGAVLLVLYIISLLI